MATEVILPRVDMDMETGKFASWLVAEGASVKKGQALFEIETDKAAMEVEAPADGVLRGVTAASGDVLPVGAIVGWIVAPGEAFDASEVRTTSHSPEFTKSVETSGEAHFAPAAMVSESDGAGLRATPAARRLASESGAALASIVGTGPYGRVQARDVAAITSTLAPSSRGELHAEWLSEGAGAPIVLLHGFGADLNGWKPLLGHLKTQRRILAIDLPGHGGSQNVPARDVRAIVDSLAATIHAYGIFRAHLVGHSLGGALAVALSEKTSNLHVTSLTLLAPAGLGPEINHGFTEGYLRAVSEVSLTPWVQLLAVDPAMLGAAMVKATLKQREGGALLRGQRALAQAMLPDGTQAYDARPVLASFDGPVKVIMGAQDRIIPPAHVSHLPGAVAVHVLANVGHMPHFEARALTAKLIADNVAAGDARS